MPRTFSVDEVRERLKYYAVSEEGSETDLRERCAAITEERFDDYVEAWEIRTGRPWNEMTQNEAKALVEKHPRLLRNPGVSSRLYPR